MIKLTSSKPKQLKFSLEVEGTKTVPNVRYVIESKPFSYVFEATYNNGSVEVNIPELKKYIDSGEYSSKVEVFLENNYFEAWSGKVLVETPIEVKIKEDFEEIEPDKVNVKIIEDVDEVSIKPKKEKIKVKKEKKTYKKKVAGTLFEEILD